jgi:hypothetical protein
MSRRSKRRSAPSFTPPTLSLVLSVPAARHDIDRLHRIGRTTEPLSRLYDAKAEKLTLIYDKVLCHMVTRILSEHGARALTHEEATDLTNDLLWSTTYVRPLGPFRLRTPNHTESLDDPEKLCMHFIGLSINPVLSREIILYVDIKDKLLCRHCGVHSPSYGKIVKKLKDRSSQCARAACKSSTKATRPLEEVQAPHTNTTPNDTEGLPAVRGPTSILHDLATSLLRHVLTSCLAYLTPQDDTEQERPAVASNSGTVDAEPLVEPSTGVACLPDVSTGLLDPPDIPITMNQWSSIMDFINEIGGDFAEALGTTSGPANPLDGILPVPNGGVPSSPTNPLSWEDSLSSFCIKPSLKGVVLTMPSPHEPLAVGSPHRAGKVSLAPTCNSCLGPPGAFTSETIEDSMCISPPHDCSERSSPLPPKGLKCAILTDKTNTMPSKHEPLAVGFLHQADMSALVPISNSRLGPTGAFASEAIHDLVFISPPHDYVERSAPLSPPGSVVAPQSDEGFPDISCQRPMSKALESSKVAKAGSKSNGKSSVLGISAALFRDGKDDGSDDSTLKAESDSGKDYAWVRSILESSPAKEPPRHPRKVLTRRSECRQCTWCGMVGTEDLYTNDQWHQPAKRACRECEAAMVQYIVGDPPSTSSSDHKADATIRVCAICARPCLMAQYTLSQWLKGTGKAKCQHCVRKAMDCKS